MISETVSTVNFKVVLLGEGCVGKTSLVLRYVEGKFNPMHVTTLQASFLTKKIILDAENEVHLNIWDTAGQERFHALGPIYYRGAHGAILVYDITDQDSFQKVKNWVKELKRMLGRNITIVIVGNKVDLEEKRTVQHEEALNYSETVGANFFETSAKENEGIDEVFVSLSKQMLQLHTNKEKANNAVRLQQRGRNDNRLLVEDDVQMSDNTGLPTPTRNRSCCATG